MWLCLKMSSENMVMVRLLQIGAKELTVGLEMPLPCNDAISEKYMDGEYIKDFRSV